MSVSLRDNILKAVADSKLLNDTITIGTPVGSITPMDSNTLHIDCDLIKLYHKELNIGFKLDKKKLENISVIEINGYRFVKQN